MQGYGAGGFTGPVSQGLLQSHLVLFLVSVGFRLAKKVAGKITQKYLTFKKASKAQLPDVH